MAGLRCLAQVALPSATLTEVLSGAQLANIHLKSLVVCNRAASSATFRLLLALANADTADKQYLFYDLPIVPNDSFTSALDIGISPGDVLKAYASNANLSISVFGE